MTEPPLPVDFQSIVVGTSAPLRFDADWQGKNADPEERRSAATLAPEWLFLRFYVRFRVITIFPDADASGRRDQLWDRDVAEVFLQPDPSQLRRYKEFEVSPMAFGSIWTSRRGKTRFEEWHAGPRELSEAKKTWVAESRCREMFGRNDSIRAVWKVNFYRVEGAAEPAILFRMAGHANGCA